MRFRCLHVGLNCRPLKASKIVNVYCALHNICRTYNIAIEEEIANEEEVDNEENSDSEDYTEFNRNASLVRDRIAQSLPR